MPTKEILNSHPVLELKKEISKTNIKGYSKMKKSEVVELMMKPNNKPKFHHIKTKSTTKMKAPAPAPAPKKTYKFKKKEKAKPSSVGIAVVPEKKKTAREKPKGKLQYLYESKAAAKATDRSRSQKVYVDNSQVRNEKGKVIGIVGEGIWNAMSDQDGLYIDRRGM